jgi:hypothetical protein
MSPVVRSGIMTKMGMASSAVGSLVANRFEIDPSAPAGSVSMGTVYRARDRFSGEWL